MRTKLHAALKRFIAHRSLGAIVTALMIVINIGAAVIIAFIIVGLEKRTESAADSTGSTILYATTIVWAVASICVTTVLAMLFMRLSASLRHLSAVAARYASGDFADRAMPAGTKEMRQLGKSLNKMARRLTSQIQLLEQQSAEQDQVFQSMDLGVLAFDEEQYILSANRTAGELLGVRADDLVGKQIGDVTDSGPLLRMVADAALGEYQSRYEFGMTTPASKTRRIQVRATTSRLADSSGDSRGAVLMLADITLVRQLESMRTDFAANASHELRTPITNVKGYVETLLEGGLDNPSDVHRFLGVIARNADRLGAIVDDMLALTNLERVDANQEELNTEPTPVGALIQTVRSNIAQDARDQNKQIKVELDELLYVQVNPRLAEQAIANLVSNAIRYCPENSIVTIRTERSVIEDSGVDAVAIYIIDEGPGIPQEHLSRLFERFYRVDKARSREKGGTGLGLAIVKHIARVHNGAISVSSELGKGTTFTLEFPIAIAEGSVNIEPNSVVWAPPP